MKYYIYELIPKFEQWQPAHIAKTIRSKQIVRINWFKSLKYFRKAVGDSIWRQVFEILNHAKAKNRIASRIFSGKYGHLGFYYGILSHTW